MGPRFSRAIFRNSFGIWIVIEAGLGLEVTGLLGALAGLRDEEGVYTFVAVCCSIPSRSRWGCR